MLTVVFDDCVKTKLMLKRCRDMM